MSDGSARILMYTQDSYGLGHLRRATNLANALVSQHPGLSVLLVVDSPVAPFFELQPHVDFIKLPTVVKVGAGVFRTGQLQTGYEQIKVLRSHLLRETVLRYVPDVLLVDHMPAGANRELMLTLAAIRRRNLPTKLVLGLRDIIDEPSVTRAVWRRERVYEAMERHYHRVLIYGSPDVFATAEEYGFARRMGERVQYCGYVCNMEEVKEPERVREKFALGDEPIVAVMAGGGADAYRLMHTYLEAVPLLSRTRPPATLMLTGPFMQEEQRKALRDKAAELGVQVRTSVGDSLSPLNAADVVVSMAGYNTLSEILRFEKRAIIVPRAGPSAEQGMRSRLFAARGLIDVVEQAKLDAPTLALALEHALDVRTRPAVRRQPDLSGVATASRALVELLPGRLPSVSPAPERLVDLPPQPPPSWAPVDGASVPPAAPVGAN
jgi:predicted glycosyltransferase